MLKENPNWKIKIITYNQSLSKKITHRLRSLYDDLQFMGLNYENISVSTFHKLARETSLMDIPNDANNDFWERVL